MRDARVEEVEHVSDSDSEERDAECPHERTIGIFPTHQGPTYLLMPHKQDKDNWLYHLTVVSGGGPNAGTQYEQLVQRLMETDGDPSCVLWRHPLLLHTKENITSPLTSLTSEALQTEAIKLFKVNVYNLKISYIDNVLHIGKNYEIDIFVSLGLSIVHVGGSRTSRHRLPCGISAKRIATMYRPA